MISGCVGGFVCGSCIRCISTDGRSRFTIPVNDAMIPVEYVAEAGTHTVLIGSDAVRVRVEPLAAVAMRVQSA